MFCLSGVQVLQLQRQTASDSHVPPLIIWLEHGMFAAPSKRCWPRFPREGLGREPAPDFR